MKSLLSYLYLATLALTTPLTSVSAASPLIWASTGGGWRAMFADSGFAYVFQQAGLLTANSSVFEGISTTSGGSWFSTQLFYSEPFYNATVLAKDPLALFNFVVQWMDSYYKISTEFDAETLQQCNVSDLQEDPQYNDENADYVTTLQDVCFLLVKYDFDWAAFIQGMMQQATDDYGDVGFVDRLALPENRILPMAQTDLLIQAALVPNSRPFRDPNNLDADSNVVYLGYSTADTDMPQVLTVPVSAAYIVEESSAGFTYGFQDWTDTMQTFLAPTQAEHSWSDWEEFYLYPGTGGTTRINYTQVEGLSGTPSSTFETPFGGTEATTVLQIAAISSAAGGSGSPAIPSVYNQMFSIGYYEIEEVKVETVWRVLAGCAAGIGASILAYFAFSHFGTKMDCFREQQSANKAGIFIGLGFGALIGIITGVFYGLGSILVPTIYDGGVNKIYYNTSFDNFAVCSQWPNPCGASDAFMIDGWFIDNPALVINVAHYQKKQRRNATSTTNGSPTEVLKAIITNTNQEWDTVFNRAQFLMYFSTYFNQGVAPADFVWAPSYYGPFRSPQIFAEYLDQDGIDALLEPIEGSNMTTAILKGTTVDNPSFGVTAGLSVEILLLSTNVNITTFVIGPQAIENLTVPLAEMTRDIAANEELVRRVIAFVES